MRRLSLIWPSLLSLLGVFVISGCNLVGLGPPEDHSEFNSAQLCLDGTAVVFTYNQYVYRPAVGWRAFPDGGIPAYLVDRKIIGLYDLATGRTRVLHAENNREWSHGQGDYNVRAVCGAAALVIAGGQLRRDLARNEVRHYWLDVVTGGLAPFPFEEELARIGRGPGYFYLAKPDRTLMIVAPAAGTPTGEHWSRDPFQAEMWVRRSDATYARLGLGVEYLGCFGDEVYYWDLADRSFKAYSLASGSIRSLEKRPDLPLDGQATIGVAVASDGRSLELRRTIGEGWEAEKLGVDVGVLNRG